MQYFIATGIAKKAQIFITNNTRLKIVNEISIIILDELLNQTDRVIID